MPRLSKEHTELLSGKVYRFLLEREDTKKKLSICRQKLASLEKARSSDRRKMYREQLDNCFKKLCSDSTDAVEFREKLRTARSETDRQSRKRAELADQVLLLQRMSVKFEKMKHAYETAKQTLWTMEEDYQKLLHEQDGRDEPNVPPITDHNT